MVNQKAFSVKPQMVFAAIADWERSTKLFSSFSHEVVAILNCLSSELDFTSSS